MTREEAIRNTLDKVLWTRNASDDNKNILTNALIKALEQEPILDKDCEHCSKTYGTLGCCDTVSNKWVYSCKEGQREFLLNKIRAEIKALSNANPSYWHSGDMVERDNVLEIIDKYKAESEVEHEQTN